MIFLVIFNIVLTAVAFGVLHWLFSRRWLSLAKATHSTIQILEAEAYNRIAKLDKFTTQRFRAQDNEMTARLDALEDQGSTLGGDVMALQKLMLGPLNQGIREPNHDFKGVPFDNAIKLIVPKPMADGTPWTPDEEPA